MKVLLATTQFYPLIGGVPRLLWTLFENRPSDVEVRVLSVRPASPRRPLSAVRRPPGQGDASPPPSPAPFPLREGRGGRSLFPSESGSRKAESGQRRPADSGQRPSIRPAPFPLGKGGGLGLFFKSGQHPPDWDGRFPGGVEAHVEWVASSPGFGNMPFTAGGAPIASRGLTSLRFLFHLWRMQRQWCPDLILCGVGYPTAVIAALLQLLGGPPVVVYTHSEDVTIKGRVGQRLLRWALNRAALVLTLTNFSRAELIRLGVTRPPIQLMPPAIDPRPFDPLRTSASDSRGGSAGVPSLPRPPALPAGGFTLLTVARLVRRKGQDTVIRALPALQQAIPDIRYVVVGSGPDEASLRALASELGVAERVIFTGNVPAEQIPAYYQFCDLYVMPSRLSDDGSEVEGFGLAYLEAGAAGKAVIAAHSGGVDAAVLDGQTGFLIEPLDVAELARRVTQLASDPTLARQMGETARARVWSEFSGPAFGARFFAALRHSLIAPAAKADPPVTTQRANR